jgi:hypothetical protein
MFVLRPQEWIIEWGCRAAWDGNGLDSFKHSQSFSKRRQKEQVCSLTKLEPGTPYDD